MYLPTLKELPTRRDMVEVFGGYNRNLRIPDGEFYDMKNMTSDHYPVLAPRGKRGKYVLVSEDSGAETIPKAQALIEKDALCFVDGSKFYINGYGHDVPGLNGSEETRLVSMGAYVIALPDKVYINTKNPTDCGKIEALYEADTESGTTVTFTPCSLDGTVYKVDANNRTETAPKNPSDLDFWIDTSSSPHTLKQWSATSAIWVTIATTYIKISATGIGKSFNQYDGVSIAGLKDVDGTPTELAEIDGSFVVWNKDDNYIMVVGFIDDAIELKTKTLKVKRSMPTMDFVVESENRLWGCKYGESDNGEIVNEIYASKLGDFRNWSCFMGVSTDSYTVSLGTDGRFTGAATHLGYPIFFKENCMHKIYGNYPSNYQVQTTSCRGVQLGCDRSIATVNEILYYKSQSGVCAYDGSLPTDISERLGDEQYSDAVAGAHN
ncbi:MAG: hypothetical protein IKK29_03625, partial [Christensenellaceae bacterium]|nr:hypothetical protein [Christensenellaceae bacterium]